MLVHLVSFHRFSPRGFLWTLSLLGSLTAPALATLPRNALASNPTFTQVCFSDNLAPAMATGDFNNDGKLDVAINPGSQSFPFFSITSLVDVYLGNGDGTFSGPTEMDIGLGYLDMAGADVNGDGNLDLVAAGPSVLLGNGDGTFQAAQSYSGGGSQGIAVGDLNQDGNPDLISTTDGKRSVTVFLNRGDGTFGGGVAYRTGTYNRAVEKGDFNRDGFLDMAAAGDDGNAIDVSVLLGKGNGKFRDVIVTRLPGFSGRDLAAADFDADGRLDLVVPLQGGDGLSVLHGKGNGTFDPPASYPMSGNTLHVATGDLNGDGSQDIVAGNYVAYRPNPGGNVTILYGNGSGAFTIGNVIPVAFGFGVLVADINADSRSDIVADACVLLNDSAVAAAAAVATSRVPGAGPENARSADAGFSPNPLRSHGILSFTLPKASNVSVHLYDIRGRRVHTIMESAWLSAGPHAVSLDRRGAGLESGVYFYRIESDGGSKSGRIVILGK